MWPQNTMAAFNGAVGLGYCYLETDVQATSDGVLAVFHDDELAPTSDSVGCISEMTWSDVSEARVGGEPIPRLEELLDAFDDVRISIDPKTDAAVEPLIEALRRPGVLDRVCIGSFSDERLKRVDDAFGDAACLSFSPREIARLRVMSLARLPERLLRASRPRNRNRQLRSGARRSRPNRGPAAHIRQDRDLAPRGRPFRGRIASIPLRQGPIPLATPRLVDYAHRTGSAVYVWTIDDPVEMDRLLDIGVDGVMTDEPTVLLDVLAERGQWPGPSDRTVTRPEPPTGSPTGA